MSNRLTTKRFTLHAAVACIFVLSACASSKAPPPPRSGVDAAPVATSSADGDVTVYSLDDGQPLPATPPSPPPAPAAPAQPSIKHTMFGWFHGSDNDTIKAPPAPAAANEPVPALTTTYAPLSAPGDAVQDPAPPPDSKSEKASPPPWTTPTEGSSDAPVAPSDQNSGTVSTPPTDGASNEGKTAPAQGRMLTGGSSALTPPPAAEKSDDTADASATNARGEPVRLYFARNNTKLGAWADPAIAKVAAAHNDNHLPIQVEGHASLQARITDPVHRAIINLKVAMDRALGVTNALIRAGVPAADIQTIAFGDARPSLAVDGKSEEAASRRVEIYSVSSQATDVVSTF